ncbi:alpha/beta fold hydrolase [Conexibacter sp. DBS9H8]|uniref:alpha/beta fold hydrolase n=1 Tax=Conexibacter sp. DBS9H8 TaxID=2937801 RepID=UPI00200E1E74|nr:alpha/beta fold hydrolase [Conexibacter sp. DBS9H8]
MPLLPADTGARLLALAGAATRRAAGLATHRVDVDGLSVTYDEGGAGAPETVLMLHGFSADRDVWGRFAAGLRDRHVLIPDLAGHGRTAFRAGAGYSAPAQADRLVAFLDVLGIDRVHVIGNSMGGFIAATLARRAPDRVRSLGLIDAAGVSSPTASPLEEMLARGENPFLFDDPAGFGPFYAMTMHRAPYVPALIRAAIAADYVRRRPELAEIIADFHGHDALDDHLSEIAAPTWVAWGRHDQLIDVSAARVWADGIPRSTLTVYDDLGHMPMFEAPRRCVADYRRFLAGL